MRALHSEQEGISAIIGLVLVLGLAMSIGLSTYISNWLPVEQSDREYNALAEVEQSFRELKQAIAGLEQGEGGAVAIKLGPEPASAYDYQGQGGELLVSPARNVDQLSPDEDTWVWENQAAATSIEMDNDRLWVSPFAGDRMRALLKFDLRYRNPPSYTSELFDSYKDEYHDDVEIVEAKLWLWVERLNPTDDLTLSRPIYDDRRFEPLEIETPVTIEVVEVVDDDAVDEDVTTWNNQPTGAQLGSPIENQVADDEGAWVGWDVTAYVRREFEEIMDNQWNDRLVYDNYVSFLLREPGGGVDGGVSTIYDFSNYAGINRWAYEGTDANGAPPPITAGTEFTSYTEIETSNDVRYWTGGGGAAADPYHRFQFTISEAPATISQLDFLWEGFNDAGTSDFYLRNFNTSAWELLGSHTETATDGTVTASRTTGISNYIDASGHLHLCAIEITNSGIDLFTDYVSVTVTTGGAGAGSTLERRAGFVSDNAGSAYYDKQPYLEIVNSRRAKAGDPVDGVVETGYIEYRANNREFPDVNFIYEGGAIIRQQYGFYDFILPGGEPDELIQVTEVPGTDYIRVTVTSYRITSESSRAGQRGRWTGGRGWASVGFSISEIRYNVQAGETPNVDEVEFTLRTSHPRAWRDYLKRLAERLNESLGGYRSAFGDWAGYDYDRLSFWIKGKVLETGVNDIYYTEKVVDLEVVLR